MKRSLSLAVAATAFFATRAATAQTDEAPAPDPPRFGSRGQWVITSGTEVNVSHSSFDHSSVSITGVTVSPGLDYFVAKRFSIGADLDIAYRDGGAADPTVTSTTRFGAGLRVGFAASLGRHLSLYPRLTVGFRESWFVLAATAGSAEHTANTSTPVLTLFVPLLIHATPRFFLGVGPGVSRTFAGDGPDTTDVYGRFIVGMVLGGPAEPAEAEPTERFGDRGTWVFTGEETSQITHSEVGGSSSPSSFQPNAAGTVSVTAPTPAASTTNSIALRPGADYFVARHLSVGAFFDYLASSGGGTTTRQLAGGPRVGYDVRLGRRVSLWPRADLAFGRVTRESAPLPAAFDVTVVSPQDTHATVISLGVGVPLLLHVAPHVFVGFGPYLRRELLRHYDGVSGGGNANTAYGLDLLLGGWL